MKRYSGLHNRLCTIENIEVADDNARKNKNKKYGIILAFLMIDLNNVLERRLKIKIF